ncbi:hypothetical protein [Umezawaea sp.]|uniref:hypothetical protein n=1 Tax=Umezawaea sp. TaxID=1955258 RepID=UPI002ED6BA98
MRIRRGVAVLAGCAAVLAAAVSPAAGSAPGGAALTCSGDVKTTGPLPIEDASWTYVYTLTWCVEGGRIVDAVQEVSHVLHTASCAWVGRKEEKIEPGVAAWTAFDMSEFRCVDGDGKTEGVNPWVDVTFYPNGHFDPADGVERSAR